MTANELDQILVKLCGLVIGKQKEDPDQFGFVAAAVIDPNKRIIARTSSKVGNKWSHAERNAINRYEALYGDIPPGSIVVTTLTPCNEHMRDRYKASCTDLINRTGIDKVYCGYLDPSQDDPHAEFDQVVTKNKKIQELCKQFADTFL